MSSFCSNEIMFLCKKLHFLLNKNMTFELYVKFLSIPVQLIQSGFRSMCSEHQLPIPLLTSNRIYAFLTGGGGWSGVCEYVAGQPFNYKQGWDLLKSQASHWDASVISSSLIYLLIFCVSFSPQPVRADGCPPECAWGFFTPGSDRVHGHCRFMLVLLGSAGFSLIVQSASTHLRVWFSAL